MRIFVALVPDGAFLNGLDRAVGIMASRRSDLHWLDRKAWHLTLAFLGEKDEEETREAEAALGRVFGAAGGADLAGFRIGADRWIAIPGRGRPRVLAAGLSMGGPESAVLARRCSAALEAGLRGSALAAGRKPWIPEARPFLDHISVARSVNRRGAAPVGEAECPFAESATGRMDRCVLFLSELGREGAHYTPLAEYPLND